MTEPDWDQAEAAAFPNLKATTPDEVALAEIVWMVAEHTPKPPYSRNTLYRIQTLIGRHLATYPEDGGEA